MSRIFDIKANDLTKLMEAVNTVCNQPQTPPPFLFHGATNGEIEGILNDGLTKNVYLSADRDVAFRTAICNGHPELFSIDTQKMIADGYEFFISDNGVWLTDIVPVQYINRDTFK